MQALRFCLHYMKKTFFLKIEITNFQKPLSYLQQSLFQQFDISFFSIWHVSQKHNKTTNEREKKRNMITKKKTSKKNKQTKYKQPEKKNMNEKRKGDYFHEGIH